MKGRYLLTQGAVRTYGRGWRYFMKWLEEPIIEAEGFIEEGRGALFFSQSRETLRSGRVGYFRRRDIKNPKWETSDFVFYDGAKSPDFAERGFAPLLQNRCYQKFFLLFIFF